MNARLRRLLVPILRAVKAGKAPTFRSRSAASQALFLVEKPASGKKRSANQQKKAGRAAARQAHNDETTVIRDGARARSGGLCEACMKRWGFWGWTMDHFDCGTGKSQRQSLQNCWILCGSSSIPGSCHYLRQRNEPSVAFWNERFALFCARYGYPAIEHIIHNPVSAAAGGSK